MKRVWALVPLKSFTSAKSRLATVLRPADRRMLTLAMARDVAAALIRSQSVARVVMVSDMPALARSIGIDGVGQFDTRRACGLNEDLTAAAAWATNQGATHALIAHADLPWLTPQAIDCFVLDARAEPPSYVRAAACKNGRGTNLLLTPIHLPLPFVFGHDSLARLCRAAMTSGVVVDVVRDATLAADVDEPGDFASLSGACARGEPIGEQTVAFLRSLSSLTKAELPRRQPQKEVSPPW